jgi:hypothetical protein
MAARDRATSLSFSALKPSSAITTSRRADSSSTTSAAARISAVRRAAASRGSIPGGAAVKIRRNVSCSSCHTCVKSATTEGKRVGRSGGFITAKNAHTLTPLGRFVARLIPSILPDHQEVIPAAGLPDRSGSTSGYQEARLPDASGSPSSLAELPSSDTSEGSVPVWGLDDDAEDLEGVDCVGAAGGVEGRAAVPRVRGGLVDGDGERGGQEGAAVHVEVEGVRQPHRHLHHD